MHVKFGIFSVYFYGCLNIYRYSFFSCMAVKFELFPKTIVNSYVNVLHAVWGSNNIYKHSTHTIYDINVGYRIYQGKKAKLEPLHCIGNDSYF